VSEVLRWTYLSVCLCVLQIINRCILHYSFVCLDSGLGLDLDLDTTAPTHSRPIRAEKQEPARSTSKSSSHSQLTIVLNCPQSITELWTERLLQTAFALDNSIQYSIFDVIMLYILNDVWIHALYCMWRLAYRLRGLWQNFTLKFDIFCIFIEHDTKHLN